MKKLLLLFLGVGLLAANDDAGATMPKPRFPIGKETTYVTEPLDADGYIDYVAALNERLRRGITPANNANVLLWKAFGPHPEGSRMPAEFFQWLEIKPPPEMGDYFLSLTRYMRAHPKPGPVLDANAIQDELSNCSQRSWKASDHPDIAAWLKVNEKPLALVVEASKSTRYYSPLVPRRTAKGRQPLLEALMPGVQTCRDLTTALTARALLRVGEGRLDEAWNDLLTCHRLGRLVAQGGTMIELMVGITIDAVAAEADLAFLEQAKGNSERIKKCLLDLRRLSPMPPAADKVDLGERFITLDIVVLLDRYGPEVMDSISGTEPEESPSILSKLFGPIDWEPALRIGNRYYDRVAEVLRIPDRATREKERKKIERELDARVAISASSIPNIFRFRSEVGERIGNIMIGLSMPGVSKMQSASDRCEQTQNNLYVACALAAYQRDHGRYPKELTALAPNYLDAIPLDIYSGKPLLYRPSANGYLLYSVGENGRDEQGRGRDDNPQGDDLSIRMPLPEGKH